jgi:hypothetical protein
MADSVAKWVSSLELPAITIVSLFLLNESFSCSETPECRFQKLFYFVEIVSSIGFIEPSLM